MCINFKKTKELTVSFSKKTPHFHSLQIDGNVLETVKETKLLGVWLSSDLKWTTHIEYICRKASKRLYALRMLKRSGVSSVDLRAVYLLFHSPHPRVCLSSVALIIAIIFTRPD